MSGSCVLIWKLSYFAVGGVTMSCRFSSSLDPLGVLWRRLLDQIEAPGLEICQSRVDIEDRPEDDLIQIGQPWLPIISELADSDVIVEDPLRELEGAGADRTLTDEVDILLGNDLDVEQVIEDRRCWRGELEYDRVLVRRLDGGDVLHLRRELGCQIRILDAVNGKGDVLGRRTPCRCGTLRPGRGSG